MAAIGRSRPLVRVIGPVIMAALLALGLEGAARLLLFAKDVLGEVPAIAALGNARLELDPYKQPSPDHLGHWTLVPGFNTSARQMAADKQASGKAAGAKAILTAGGSAVLVINQDGYKGPPITPGNPRPRILVLGDSVIFGYAGADPVDSMQAALPELGVAAESINAGVEGYAVKNHRYRLDAYRRLEPDMVIVLLGWNDLYAIDPSWFTWWRHSVALRLAQKAPIYWDILTRRTRQYATHLLTKEKRADPRDPDIAFFHSREPEFVKRLEELAEAFDQDRTRVAIATLPGLYRSGTIPSEAALRLGHLPEFTDNPLAFAALVDAANDGLRRLAERRGWLLIDLAHWSATALDPPEDYFVDTVHMTAEGYRRMGRVMAEAVALAVPGTGQRDGARP